MRVLFFVTHTPNCEPFWRSLEAIGHEVFVQQYDDRPNADHGQFVQAARDLAPDFIVYIGAYAPSHGRPVLEPDTLLRLREVSPLILLCGDAADDPWWPVLEEYHRLQCFTVMVAIDGSFETPIAGFSEGLTLLTPTDPRAFSSLPWGSRTVSMGMIGGMGHRGRLVNDLQGRGLLDFRQGPVGRSYREFAQLMCSTKLTLNCAETGTGKRLHVKGRVIEAGFAGSAVLEVRGSPLNKWFEPGREYFEYSSLEEIIQVAALPEELLEAAALRYHYKMIANHHPVDFWDKVLTKAGLL